MFRLSKLVLGRVLNPVPTALPFRSALKFARSVSSTITTNGNRRTPLVPGGYQVSQKLEVPGHIERPQYSETGRVVTVPELNISDEVERRAHIKGMRKACKLASYIRAYAGSLVEIGRTLDEIDKLIHAEIIAQDAYPSPLNFHGFPKSSVASLNEVICHGIPDKTPLQDGDILKLDIVVYVDGFHGDCCGTFLVGNADSEARRLAEVTRRCLYSAIEICGPFVPFRMIGSRIQDIAEKENFGVVAEFCGHAVGRNLHRAPQIMHIRNSGPGMMVPGMTFTIEPILTEGDTETSLWPDGWGVSTVDKKWAAQIEETLLITEDGVEVLTKHD